MRYFHEIICKNLKHVDVTLLLYVQIEDFGCKILSFSFYILDIYKNYRLNIGHYEKGLALCQALLDFNLFQPGFSSPGGQDIQEKVNCIVFT